MALFSTGLSLTYHLAHSVLNVINVSLHPIPVCMVILKPKVLFLAPTFHYVHLSSYTLISSLSLNHHLYADDTQIVFSFYAPDFPSNTTYLLNALQHISSWMTANLLYNISPPPNTQHF